MRMGELSNEMNGAWQVSSADRGGGDKGARRHSAVPAEEEDASACEADLERARLEAELKQARLVRTIESEIVPRLVLTRRVHRDTAHVRESQGPDGSDVKELVRLLMAHDVTVASAYVETVRQRGATLERICLDLLAPAARELGVRWEQDECDFMQVTVGLCRLHQLLRELSPEFDSEETCGDGGRRILLAPCPGDQHTFGISLVAQFLRRAEWDVWHEFPSTDNDILNLVRRHWFAVVGLSVGSETRLDQLTTTIARIRRESRNPGIGVMVGGPVLLERPEVAQQVGADATAADGPQAVLRAENICRAMRTAN
jgi:methanogenic corrinoid protein MtbC1